MVAKGAGVLDTPDIRLQAEAAEEAEAGKYKLMATYIQDGATTGVTQTVPIKFKRSRGSSRHDAAGAWSDGPVNVDAGPRLAAGYVR